jgi:hypothetical protein
MASPPTERQETEIPLGTRVAARLDGRRPVHHADDFYARGRARWLRRCLDQLGERPLHMIALGWDRGATNSELFANLHIKSLVTVDVARERPHTSEIRSADGKATYVHVSEYRATESADLAYTSGVFERIPPRERSAAAVLMYRSLKSGGLFAVWQTNPWSPAAMFPVTRTRGRSHSEAIAPPDARRLLRGVGFDIMHTTSAFFFPRSFSWVHPVESLLAPIPIGGQYMVLARKP